MVDEQVHEARRITREEFSDIDRFEVDEVKRLANGQVMVSLEDTFGEVHTNGAFQGFALVPYLQAGYLPTSVSTTTAWFKPIDVGLDFEPTNYD